MRTIQAEARAEYPALTVNGAMLAFLSGGGGYAAVVLADDPISYWRLGDISGSSAVDLGSLNNTGTYTFDEAPANVATWTPRAGVVPDNEAVSFTEVGRCLNVPSLEVYHEVFASYHDFSYEFWMKATPEASTNDWRLTTLTGAGFSRMLWFYRTGVDFPVLGVQRLSQDAGSSVKLAIPDSVLDGEWHHVVFTKSGMTPTLWVDAVAVATDTDVTSVVNGGYFTIGGMNTAGLASFPGALDEIAAYDYCLSGEQITAHYNAAVGA
jgi:hypothetical protein